MVLFDCILGWFLNVWGIVILLLKCYVIDITCCSWVNWLKLEYMFILVYLGIRFICVRWMGCVSVRVIVVFILLLLMCYVVVVLLLMMLVML